MRKDEGGWNPDEFRSFVLTAASRAGYERPADLARAAGVRDGMLSKWLHGREQPSIASLRKLAGPLRVKVIDLAVLAGRVDPAEIEPETTVVTRHQAMHPLALELARMLAEDSPLTDQQRDRLIIVVDHSVDPYRRPMKRRRTSGPAA